MHLATFYPATVTSRVRGFPRSPPTARETGWPNRTVPFSARHRQGPRLTQGSSGELANHLNRRHASRAPPSLQTARQLRIRHQLAQCAHQGRLRPQLSPDRRLILRGPSTTPSPSSASMDGPSASTTRACRLRSDGPQRPKGPAAHRTTSTCSSTRRRRTTRSTNKDPRGPAHSSPRRSAGLPRLQLRLQRGSGRGGVRELPKCDFPVWWLDVENDICGQYWSCNQALNSATIQGAIDLLHARRLTPDLLDVAPVSGITGGYVPSGPQVPSGRGAYWTSPPYPPSYGYYPPSALAPYCSAKYAFAGGDTCSYRKPPARTTILRPDYAC